MRDTVAGAACLEMSAAREVPDASQVKALLVDVGGVVIDIDFDRVFRAWCPSTRLTFDEIRERFRMDTAYRRHERGEIDAPEYFDHLRKTLHLNGTDDEIATGWNKVYVREIAPTLASVRRARSRVSCFAFSNTNATHYAAWPAVCPNVNAAFDRIFVSSELGHRKPEPAAFEAVAKATGIDLSGMLFFDDTRENVLGARALGLQAVHVDHPGDVGRTLTQIGVI